MSGTVTQAPQTVAKKAALVSGDSYAYFRGEFIPLSQANVSIATHALNYGTGCFEGIRAYWNARQGQLYGLKLREHYERMANSCRILKIQLPHSPAELTEITRKLLEMNDYHQDVYIRPLAFKATTAIGVKLSGLEDAFGVFTVPMGDYLDTAKGLHVAVSSWTRLDDNSIPTRAKVTGSYINAALAVDDARAAGYDDCIMLTPDGHVAEGSSCNLFVVRDGKVITSPVTEAILEGITRKALFGLVEDLGYPTEVRPIDRTELYVADEIFLCGTGVQVASVTKVDHRPVGSGQIGPIAKRIQETYFAAVRGDDPRYADWLTPVYTK